MKEIKHTIPEIKIMVPIIVPVPLQQKVTVPTVPVVQRCSKYRYPVFPKGSKFSSLLTLRSCMGLTNRGPWTLEDKGGGGG